LERIFETRHLLIWKNQGKGKRYFSIMDSIHRIKPKPYETGEARFVLPFDKEITNVLVQVK
jgi:hypothetical protein